MNMNRIWCLVGKSVELFEKLEEFVEVLLTQCGPV